jgi:hypothetical protein
MLKSSRPCRLPAGFERLEKYCGKWDHNTTQARWNERASSSMSEIRQFYDEAVPLAAEALTYLESKAMDCLSEEDASLMKLLLSLASCAMAVELHKVPRAPYSPFPHGIRVLRGGYPFG